MLNWFKISKYMGEQIKVVRDRAYTTQRDSTDIIEGRWQHFRVIILLLASTGMRIGAIPSLKI